MAIGTAPTKEAREAKAEREEFEAKISRAFGNPIRVRIMEILNEHDASASDLAGITNISASLLSYHFGVLAECDCI
jgi:DNA-binding transcriptional ArsR family regulator